MTSLTVTTVRRILFCASLLPGLLSLLPGCGGSAGTFRDDTDAVPPAVQSSDTPRRTERPAPLPAPAYRYDAIDRHAAETPKSAEATAATLAAYLTTPARNEREKIRAIFRWVTANIDYDWEGYQTKRYAPTSPEGVLKNRRSVCDGYASLVERLGKEAGLEIVKISGYAKGYSYAPGDRLTQGATNHAWNAVRLDGEWNLLDATWGAGHISSEENRYVRTFQEHFFLTPPEQFIYDHFPQDSQWQLLDTPLSGEQYEQLAFLRPGAFTAGLRVLSHSSSRIITDGEVTISFVGPESLELRAQLSESGFGNHALTRTFVQRTGGQFDVRIRPPYEGSFTLHIFTRIDPNKEKMDWGAEYTIESTQSNEDDGGFPLQYANYRSFGCRLDGPFNGVMKAGSTETFRIRVPGALGVAVVNDGAWYYLTRNGDLFEGEVTVASPGGATLYAKMEEDGQFQGVLMYEVKQ